MSVAGSSMFASLLQILLGSQVVPRAPAARCRNLPGDPGWPSQNAWNSFNTSVEGRLIHTVPVGTPCHSAHFNAESCAVVQKGWTTTEFHEESSSSLMSSYFANKSCDPFSGPDSQCIIGTYVEYAVNVSTPAHVISTVNFAKKHNIRFVVRNTGHDYMGKSTGQGALSIWMHHLKSTEWIDDYASSNYRGPAVKASAGIQVSEIYAQADARGYAVVAGDCPTVGYVGGYIQGGGHSPLSSKHGLAADQTLSFEVVTTTGVFTTASPSHNADLYWALSGGGGGTYAIVWSVTVKVYPDVPITSAMVSFAANDTVSLEKWWTALEFYQASIPKYTAAGIYSLSAISLGSFLLGPSFFPNATHAEVSKLFQPLLDHLTNASIPFTSRVTTHAKFLQAYEAENNPIFFGVGDLLVGGRLLPRSLWQTADRFKEMTSVIKNIIQDGAVIVDIATSPTLAAAGHPKNAVLPAWRQSERLFITSRRPVAGDNATLEEIADLRHTITSVYGAALRKLTPDSGSYLNEADALDPDWKNAFYGPNYSKLLRIKNKWDPEEVLYGPTAVGGDRWAPDGRGALCQV